MSDVYDYVIVGSGMAGLTVALLLARAGNSVCLLEAHEHPGGCAHSFPIGRYTFSRGLERGWPFSLFNESPVQLSSLSC